MAETPSLMRPSGRSPIWWALPGGLLMVAFVLWAAPLGRGVRGTLLAAWLGLLFGTASYCLHRARPHLSPDWIDEARPGFGRKWTSLWLDDYEADGQPWMRAFYGLSLLVLLSWLAAAFLGMNSGFR